MVAYTDWYSEIIVTLAKVYVFFSIYYFNNSNNLIIYPKDLSNSKYCKRIQNIVKVMLSQMD